MDGYSMDFSELILEYTTKVCNLSRNYPLPHSNLFICIFRSFQIFLKGKECFDSQILTINEATLKSLKFKPLPSGYWKHEEEISANDIEAPPPQPYLEMIPSP